jgi:hypothetical protein
MQRTQGELYLLVKDLWSKAQFSREISKRFASYGELLDKDTIAYLIVDELGRNSFSLTQITDLKPDADATVVASVKSISDVKTFRKKNGTVGKVLNMEVSDGSGVCRLVLWNDDIELVKGKGIKVGTKVRVINGYTKTSYGGVELNLGKWGMLEVEASTEPCPETGSELVLCGVLQSREATKAFFKDNGEFGFVTTITVKTSDGQIMPVTLWDSCVKAVQGIGLGETVKLQRVERRSVNGSMEWHVQDEGAIQRESPRSDAAEAA